MKYSLIVLCLILAFIILAGCQSATSTGADISFMVFGDPAELAAYRKLVDSFEQQHPEIEVELTQIPGQADYRKRLTADIIAGTPADVVLINYRRYAAFASTGTLEPLGAYLERSQLIKESDFYPEAIKPYKWKDMLMCIPQNLSSLVVYYNKGLFDQAGIPYPAPGWTWEEFLSAAQSLTKDFDNDGRTDQFGVGIEPSLIRLAPFIWQLGGQIVDYEAAPSTLVLTSPKALEAAHFFFGLQTAFHVAPKREDEASEDSESRFMNGRLAMFFNSRRGVPTYREAAKFDWDVARLPQSEHQASILHSDAYCLPSASKDKEAAWAFIEYANSVEGQTIVAATGRTVPSLIAVANSPAFLDPNTRPTSSRVFLEAIPFLRPLPVHPNWAEIEEVASEELARGFYGEVEVSQAMSNAIERTEEYFILK
ncbi:MAG TPA: sugar ABC transporter substrate-binding protein [Anaerolineales bacterium]|nr:sugar ABC transporter substrate-binding protein [Anaerolineales bacterium]